MGMPACTGSDGSALVVSSDVGSVFCGSGFPLLRWFGSECSLFELLEGTLVDGGLYMVLRLSSRIEGSKLSSTGCT